MKISNAALYFKAIVKVEVEGFFVERLINLCKINNIRIWEITYITPGRISFKLSPKELRKIKPYLKKTKCKLKIVEKQGIYFDLFRYRKRRLAMYILIFLILTSFAMSSFVWKIEISGNERVSQDEIYEALKNSGIKVGKNKLFVSKRKAKDYIRAKIYDVAWVGIDISGTTMNVKIVEKIISTEEDKTKNGNIVATKSGVITKIIAENGTAKFKTGSYIEKGMIGIEGKILSNLTEPTNVHASGILKANVEYKYEKKYSYKEKVKKNTGKIRRGLGIKINNKEFVVKYLPKENKYDINSKVKRIGLFGINFSFIFNTYDEYIEEDITYTYDELTKRGEQEATNYERSILTQDRKLVEKRVDVNKETNEVIYKVTYIVEENIGSFVETGEN